MANLQQLAVLRVLATRQREALPPLTCSELAEHIGLQRHDRYQVWGDLHALQQDKLLKGAPMTARGAATPMRITPAGYLVAGFPPPSRVIRVREPQWRCLECNSVALDPSKACAMCPVLAKFSAVRADWFFDPAQGAA